MRQLLSDEFVEIINRLILIESESPPPDPESALLDSPVGSQKQEPHKFERIEWKQFLLSEAGESKRDQVRPSNNDSKMCSTWFRTFRKWT